MQPGRRPPWYRALVKDKPPNCGSYGLDPIKMVQMGAELLDKHVFWTSTLIDGGREVDFRKNIPASGNNITLAISPKRHPKSPCFRVGKYGMFLACSVCGIGWFFLLVWGPEVNQNTALRFHPQLAIGNQLVHFYRLFLLDPKMIVSGIYILTWLEPNVKCESIFWRGLSEMHMHHVSKHSKLNKVLAREPYFSGVNHPS